MGQSLTASVLEAHRVAEPGRSLSRGVKGARLVVRADHVVCEGRAAVLAFGLFETLGLDRVACELALACAEGDPLVRFAAAEEQTQLERLARRRGAVFSRAGNGASHHVYASRFAAPGRLVVGTGARLCACGALGTLALRVSAAEAAAALAGGALEIPAVVGARVRLLGKPPAWLSGEDVGLELERRLAFAPLEGRVLEFVVVEENALLFPDRVAIAARAAMLGATAGLFPSDDATRAFLKAEGREADWKPLAVEPVEEPTLDLDFSDFEPLVTSAGRGSVRRLRELGESRVSAVWIGPDCSLVDLERLAERWSTGRVADGVDCEVSLDNRQIHESAARSGLLSRFRATGVRLGAGPTTIRRPRPNDGVALACGAPGARDLGWLETGIAACAAAALAGTVADPRQQTLEIGDSPRATLSVDDRMLVRPVADGTASSDAGRANAPLPRAPGISGPVRGTVLIRLGDHVGMNQILPWGARVRPGSQDIELLARHAFAGIDPGFSRRARAQGQGWVVAGRELGSGTRREEAVLVAIALGVRGMLARSFDQGFRRLLRLHGVLGLRFRTDVDASAVEAGDELEIPDLPDGLEAGKPLVVRNLTQGAQYALDHDLDEAGVEQVRAGGLLATMRREAATTS
jgi:aconitate hydratase